MKIMKSMGKEHSYDEVVLTGKSASPGIVLGEVWVYNPHSLLDSEMIKSKGTASEKKKLDDAMQKVLTDLHNMAHFTSRKSKDINALHIIETQKEFVRDPELYRKMVHLIEKEAFHAARAVQEAFQSFINLIEQNDNEFIKSRLVDLRDIRDRLIRYIQQNAMISSVQNNAIVVAKEFSPTDIVMLSRQNVQGIVVDSGGLTSHAAIIANSIGVPIMVDTKTASQLIRNGDTVIIDGANGKLIVRPDERKQQQYEELIAQQNKLLEEETSDELLPSTTKCGKEVKLRANIEFEEELHKIKKFNVAGIGLMRTESLFFSDGNSALEVSKQERFYESALKHSGDEPLTIRLFDVGGDKLLDEDESEANPFLGWRGIRILLAHRELLRSQLEAILKVSGRYPRRCRILVPMICTLEEIKSVRIELNNAISRLDSLGIAYDKSIELGIMVEVPSVAIQAEAYADLVDFFSIGTNDLTQYTLAVDRGNNLISQLYQQMHPSVWQLIRMTAEGGRKKGIQVSVCGELASNPFAALILVGLGICDLSMAPVFVPAVKKTIHKHDMQEIKDLTDRVLNATSMAEINLIVKQWKSVS
ncbi:MAG: phosphoenolpyruvate--protein phosphotransferase [Balneolales bacterium]